MVVAVYWQNVLTLFGSVTLLCRSDRVLQKGYCFLPHQGRCCTHEPRQFLIISAVQTHTHSQIDLWLGLLGHSDRFLFLKKKTQHTEAFHFINRDKSLSNSKQSHSAFEVLTCLIVMLYLFEFHWRIVERNYVKCWICYATSFGIFKSDAHLKIVCFCLLFAVLMCYDHSSAASRLNMVISVPKKQVFDGRITPTVRQNLYSCVLTTVLALCVIQHLCVVLILETCYLIKTGTLFTLWT